MLSIKLTIPLVAALLFLALIGSMEVASQLGGVAHAEAWRQSQPPLPADTQLVGRLHFTGNENARTGSFVLEIDPINPPPEGTHYELWLRSDDGDSLLSLGAFDVEDGRVFFSSGTDQELLADYNTALISIEPDEHAHAPAAEIILSNTLPAELLTPTRRLLFAAPESEKSSLGGAVEQLHIVISHTEFMQDAVAGEDLVEAQRHAEHIINVLDGRDGFLFGDLDRDGQVQNPGDGYGVRVYLEDVRRYLITASLALSATAAVTEPYTQAQLALQMAEDAQQLVSRAMDRALQVFAADSAAEAQRIGVELAVIAIAVDDQLATAYDASLQMAAYSFFAAESLQPAATATARAPTTAPTRVATSTRLPTATSPAATSQQVSAASIPTPTVTPEPLQSSAQFTLPALSPAVARWVNPVDGGEYVYVPGGEFEIGADGAAAVSALERPAHEVAVGGFWLQRTEVTNEQYGRCVAAGACPAPRNERWEAAAYAAHPVTDVDWASARAYAAWAGGRLPSEAEWERACRGEDGRLFPWGDASPTAELSNYDSQVGDTTAVGSYADGASPYGLLDMSGNVWEWTSSLEQPYPYDADDGREEVDAEGKRIARGGSYYYTQYQLRCITRSGFAPTTANRHFGLRVAVSSPFPAED